MVRPQLEVGIVLHINRMSSPLLLLVAAAAAAAATAAASQHSGVFVPGDGWISNSQDADGLSMGKLTEEKRGFF